MADGVADETHGWVEVFEIQTRVDPDISPEDAVLLCTWREALGAFSDFNLKPGDDVLVFGGGPVGLDNLAAAIGEDKDTIEDVIEPISAVVNLPMSSIRVCQRNLRHWQVFNQPISVRVKRVESLK